MSLTPRLLVATGTFFSALVAQAAPLDFSGHWFLDLRTPAERQQKVECGSAGFELMQTGDRIVGSHSMATVGCSRLNEGGAEIVKGVVVAGVAVLVVTSARNGAVVMGTGSAARRRTALANARRDSPRRTGRRLPTHPGTRGAYASVQMSTSPRIRLVPIMSIRADLFVAARPDAPRYEASIRRGEQPPFSEVHVSGHITGLEFGTLRAILERQPWYPGRHMPMDLSPEEGGDTWLNELPGRFTELLAALDDKGADEALVSWAATEELQCDPGNLRPGLTALLALARSALRQGKAVFLWGST